MKGRVVDLPRGWHLYKGELGRGSAAGDMRSTALHEAAHAVVAHRLGAKVLRLWLIQRNRRTLGKLTSGFTETEWKRPKDPLAFVLYSLAGHEAECAIYGRPLTSPPEGDWVGCRKIHCSAAALNWAHWSTRRIVMASMPEIRRVQRALLVGGRLTRRQFLKARKETK